MKVALVYDRINKFGGAERLLLALNRVFPKAPLYTLVHDKKRTSWANIFSITPSFLNAIPFLRTRHELLAPVAPLAFESLRLDGYDVVISITSGDAKAIITKPNQLHLCYCLTPTRYFWSGSEIYQSDIKFKIIPLWLKKYFRTLDLLISTRPDQYIAISKEVKKRVKLYYHRHAMVVYPPIEDKFYSKKTLSLDQRDYYLVVSRLVPYKRTDLVVKAFKELNLPLIVVGVGSELPYLKTLGGPKTVFVGSVNDDRLIEYYRHAKALIFPQDEDFGLVPLESQACGTPVIAFRQGGALETVNDHKTGLFFDSQDTDSIIDAVKEFSKIKFNPLVCRRNAKRFNFSLFAKKFKTAVTKYHLHLSSPLSDQLYR